MEHCGGQDFFLGPVNDVQDGWYRGGWNFQPLLVSTHPRMPLTKFGGELSLCISRVA